VLSFLQGKLKEKHPQHIIVQAGGLGFKIFIPTSFYFSLPGPEADVMVYTVLLLKDDGPLLYGFPGSTERDFFKTLLSVSGVGPKVALALLGHLTIQKFLNALHAEDAGAITAVPGIGIKTARRLIYELKEKLPVLETNEHAGAIGTNNWLLVEEALLGLGYSSREVAHARDLLGAGDGSVEELFKKTLALLIKG
jgi:Holliday junction DNA helicase RuvA